MDKQTSNVEQTVIKDNDVLEIKPVRDIHTVNELKRLRKIIDQVPDEAKLEKEGKKYTENGHSAFLSYKNGIPVGYLEVDERDGFDRIDVSDYAHLSRIGVTEEARGKGVGKELVKVAEKHTKDIGKKGIWLDFLSENKKARKLYKSTGFKEIRSFTDEGKLRVLAIKELNK